jgi:hypothetical protein
MYQSHYHFLTVRQASDRRRKLLHRKAQHPRGNHAVKDWRSVWGSPLFKSLLDSMRDTSFRLLFVPDLNGIHDIIAKPGLASAAGCIGLQHPILQVRLAGLANANVSPQLVVYEPSNYSRSCFLRIISV